MDAATLALIKRFEGSKPVGWDYKQYSGPYGVKIAPGERIDLAEAERRLQAEVAPIGGYLDKAFGGVNMTPQQRSALTSFTYNVGPGWMNSPTRLASAVRSGDWDAAANVMREYNKAGGKVLPGLVNRRDQEAGCCFGGPMPETGAKREAGLPPLSLLNLNGPQPTQPSPPTQGQPPMAQPEQPGPMDDFIARLQSPMTQQGLGLLMAAMQGGDLNAGASAGAQRGNMALQQLLQMRKMKQEEARCRALEAAIGQSDVFRGMSPADRAVFAANPEAAQQLMVAQAKRNMDPLAKLQEEQLRLNLENDKLMNPLKRQQTEAAIKAAGQKDALDEYIMGIIGGGQKPQSAPSPIQPQSFVPQDGGEDPNLIRTQTAPQQPAPQDADPLVDTPAGKMPASRARQLGLALAMRGKGDAGRMIADPAVDQAKLAKEARNKVDSAELDLTEQAARIKSIKRQFRPEFQTYEESIKQAGVGFADKFDFLRSKLPPEILQKHAEFISFRRDAIDNVNRYIKEITGAAMAIPEAERIMKGIPNESDGPTAFKAKIDAIERASLMAIARTRYSRENGFRGQPWSGNADDAAKALSIEGFSRIIDQEGDAMSRQLRAQNPNAKPEQINGAVKSMLRQKFRLDI